MPCTCVTDMTLVSLCPSAHHRLHKCRFQDKGPAALGKILCLLDGILDGQVGKLLKIVWCHVHVTSCRVSLAERK